MPVLQVYFPTKEEMDKVRQDAKKGGFRSTAEYVRYRLLEAKS